MANPRHLKILQQGAETWNKWRVQHPRVHPNLRSAEIVGLDPGKPDLRGVNLREVDLRDVALVGLPLQGADLDGADLRGAYLWETSLEASNLNNVSLGDTFLN